ncbi:hypothetical protein ACFOD9_09705 [Novosphingobium bradum]|uniref:DUF937 domain-containing protein n=1 Tax=Novosphingobium bradum TaxID=1737444 RepID=A0ABV7IPC1_9SPHN
MSLLDGLLGQVAQNVDVAGLAAKVGLDPAMAEKAIAALGAAHAAPEDTIGLAAQKTGLDPAVLSQIVGQIGGEGSLGQLSGLIQGNPALSGLAGMLDRNGDGNPLDDLAGMAKGLFGKG